MITASDSEWGYKIAYGGATYIVGRGDKLVIPYDLNIKLTSTSKDHVHAWSLKQLDFDLDAIPGFKKSKILSVKKIGLYKGSCSEPDGGKEFELKVVERNDFNQWVANLEKQS